MSDFHWRQTIDKNKLFIEDVVLVLLIAMLIAAFTVAAHFFGSTTI